MGYTDLEEKLNDLVEEVSNWKEKTEKERQLAIYDVEFLDGEMVKIVNNVKDIKVQITQIKNSDVNNGSEFYRLKKELYEEIAEQRESIEKEIDVVSGNVEKASIKTIELIHSHNEDQPIIEGMVQDLKEILKWKKDLEKEKLEEKVDNYIKTDPC